jgi:methylaspartate ammonia-lyase
MKIKEALAVKGLGGFFWDDQAAIKEGAKRNGFTYFGDPVTPGFYAIRQPSEAVSIMLILDDDSIALGDCCSVQYSARSGRESVFRSHIYHPLITEKIVPNLIGREITTFRKMAEEFDSINIDGKPIHHGIRYGVTQAFLDAVAKARRLTMTEVIAEEYGTTIAEKPVPIFSQTGDDWYDAVDRAILRRSRAFPHGLINSLEKLEKLADYIKWTRNRINQLSDDKYRPYLHYDVYATLGIKYGNNIPKMVKHLMTWEDIAKPYKLIIEEPFDMKSRDGNIEMTKKLIAEKKEGGVDVIICADEWCNTLDDIKAFVDNQAAEMIQIKNPDLGGVNNIIEAALYCQKYGVLPYLGGSCCETDVSARVTWHIALATKPFETLAKPGMGVDESYQAAVNEMERTLALIQRRRKKQNAKL